MEKTYKIAMHQRKFYKIFMQHAKFYRISMQNIDIANQQLFSQFSLHYFTSAK